MILFLSVSLVGAANIEGDGNDTSLFSYDNVPSQDYLTQSNVVDGSIDELQMDSNLKSEDYKLRQRHGNQGQEPRKRHGQLCQRKSLLQPEYPD